MTHSIAHTVTADRIDIIRSRLLFLMLGYTGSLLSVWFPQLIQSHHRYRERHSTVAKDGAGVDLAAVLLQHFG